MPLSALLLRNERIHGASCPFVGNAFLFCACLRGLRFSGRPRTRTGKPLRARDFRSRRLSLSLPSLPCGPSVGHYWRILRQEPPGIRPIHPLGCTSVPGVDKRAVLHRHCAFQCVAQLPYCNTLRKWVQEESTAGLGLSTCRPLGRSPNLSSTGGEGTPWPVNAARASYPECPRLLAG